MWLRLASAKHRLVQRTMHMLEEAHRPETETMLDYKIKI